MDRTVNPHAGAAARWCALLLLGVAVLLGQSPASAKSNARPIGFSNLVIRIEADDMLGIDDGKYRVYILEELRKNGYNAVGAENLVFNKDRSDAAELALGGTVTELECAKPRGGMSCRIGVEWQVLDVKSDTVVYRVLTRAVQRYIPPAQEPQMGKRLLTGALESLMSRPAFKSVNRQKAKPASPSGVKFAEATFARCSAEPTPMPGSVDAALNATLIIESGKSMGSGFLINGQGLVLTAAHVVTTATPSVRTKDGHKYSAQPLRVNRQFDVALLYVNAPGERTCLALNTDAQAQGNEVWALGSPASDELAFSVTRGIVSGTRTFNGVRFLQTDASINAGNSGGPLMVKDGRVAAIASWKLAGASVEGLGFGVPIADALKNLGLVQGDKTTETLTKERPVTTAAPKPNLVVGDPDAIPRLDPRGDKIREDQERRAEAIRKMDEQDAAYDRMVADRTPWYIPAMRYGGLAVAGIGLLGAGVTFQKYNSDSRASRAEYLDARAINDLMWGIAFLGLGTSAASFFVGPSIPSREEFDAQRQVGVWRIKVRGTF